MTFERVQVLRFLAATAVALVHAEATTGWYLNPRLDQSRLWFQLGGYGVDLFFVISGFIIAHLMVSRADGAGVFLRRRVERIVPLYWLCTFAMFAVVAVTGQASHGNEAGAVLPELLRSLVFTGWSANDFRPLLTVGWSLESEMLFYLLATVCLAVARRPVLLLLAVLALLVAVGRLAGPGKDNLVLNFVTAPMMVEFMFGMLVAGILHRVTPWAAAAIVAVALAFVPLTGNGDQVWKVGIVFALIVGAAAWLDRRGPAGAALQPFVRLGDASYSIYLTHFFTLNVYCRVVGRMAPGLPLTVLALVGAVVAIIVGHFVYVLVERPTLRWLRARKPAPVAAPAE